MPPPSWNGDGLPVRAIGVPPRVGWHAVSAFGAEQQYWLSPPFWSTQTGLPVTGSVPMVAQVDGPEHPPRTQVPPVPQASAEGVTKLGSPGCATHGIAAEPPGSGASVDVPVVSGSR